MHIPIEYRISVRTRTSFTNGKPEYLVLFNPGKHDAERATTCRITGANPTKAQLSVLYELLDNHKAAAFVFAELDPAVAFFRWMETGRVEGDLAGAAA